MPFVTDTNPGFRTDTAPATPLPPTVPGTGGKGVPVEIKIKKG